MILARLNKFPPCLCRLVARKDGGMKLMSNRDIAARAGLSKSSVIKISRLERWDTLPLKTVESFSRACGVDLLQPSRHIHFLRTRGNYLKGGTPQQKKLVLRLMNGVKQALATPTMATSVSRGEVRAG